MNCDDCIDRLQVALDARRAPAADADVAAHLQTCPTCRETCAAAERLQRGLESLPPPAPPAGYRDRVVAAVRRDRQRRQRVRMVFRIAAAVVIGTLGLWLGVSQWNRPEFPSSTDPESGFAKNEAPAPEKNQTPMSLQAQLYEARDATRGLTRLAQDTARGARLFVPPADRFSEPLPLGLEPPALSVNEMSRTVADGFEPVTDSARRAWGMFRRLLPGDERKKS